MGRHFGIRCIQRNWALFLNNNQLFDSFFFQFSVFSNLAKNKENQSYLTFSKRKMNSLVSKETCGNSPMKG